MNFARANILRRIREAAERHPLVGEPIPDCLTEGVFAPITEPVGRFEAEFVAQRGELVANLDEFLCSFMRVVCDESVAVQSLRARWPKMMPTDSLAELARADLAVTGCEWLVAQTGTVVIAHRALSVLPPVHLVVAHRDQVLPDLFAALTRLRMRYGPRWPSAVTFITGPSRTADIEKILVMGAHGPKRLALHWLET